MPHEGLVGQAAPKNKSKPELLWDEIRRMQFITSALQDLKSSIMKEPETSGNKKENKVDSLNALLQEGAEIMASERITQEDLISQIRELLF